MKSIRMSSEARRSWPEAAGASEPRPGGLAQRGDVLWADTILVYEGGRIVERGTHAELLAEGGSTPALHGAVRVPPDTKPTLVADPAA